MKEPQSKKIGQDYRKIKRKLGLKGDMKAGDLIAKARELPKKKMAIMGLV